MGLAEEGDRQHREQIRPGVKFLRLLHRRCTLCYFRLVTFSTFLSPCVLYKVAGGGKKPPAKEKVVVQDCPC